VVVKRHRDLYIEDDSGTPLPRKSEGTLSLVGPGVPRRRRS